MITEIKIVFTYDSVLRGFERITLKPDETKTVHFVITPYDLKLLDKNMKWNVEPDYFEIKIGSSSEEIKLKQIITILP